jgi:hypothetical protein
MNKPARCERRPIRPSCFLRPLCVGAKRRSARSAFPLFFRSAVPLLSTALVYSLCSATDGETRDARNAGT